MFAGLVETHVRITFLGEVQVDHTRRDIRQIIATIQRQVQFVLALELLKFFRILTFNPAGGGNIHRFVQGVNVVFAF